VKKILIAATLTLSFNIYATTAILCGPPEEIDQDENNAILHLIFDNYDSKTKDEIRVFSKGEELVIKTVGSKKNMINLKIGKNMGTIAIDSDYIDESVCEDYSYDKTFNINWIKKSNTVQVENCRCFQD